MESTLDKATPGASVQYDLEVLCASWNPLAATLAEQADACRELVADLAGIDAEGFLASFYRAQQG
jgi:hypothetical protein